MVASEIVDTLRVAIVAGHPVIRGVVGLACQNVEGATVTDVGGSVSDAKAILRSVPDVLVLDLELPDGDGLDALRKARRLNSGSERPRILVLSDREDGATSFEAFRLGAAGFLTKSDGLRGVTTAIRKVAAGERVVPEQIRSDVLAQLGRFARNAEAGASVEAALTEREREVLRHLADGATIQQIGRRLGISARTVETHVAKLYRKLGVDTRVRAVARAAALGLIDLA